MTVTAVYSDKSGNRFSCPVVFNEGVWKLSTALGLRDVSYFIEESDAVGGLLEFIDYEIDTRGSTGRQLRPADCVEVVYRIRKSLPWPEKPPQAPEPKIQATEDFRVHVEQGSDSFRVLQEAGAKEEISYRANREQTRREALSVLNPLPGPAEVRAARALNTAIAQQRWNPRRPEPIPPPQMGRQPRAEDFVMPYRKTNNGPTET